MESVPGNHSYWKELMFRLKHTLYHVLRTAYVISISQSTTSNNFITKKLQQKGCYARIFQVIKPQETTEYAIFNIPTSISFLILQPDLKHAVLLSVNLHRTRFKHFQKQVTFKFSPQNNTDFLPFFWRALQFNSIALNFLINWNKTLSHNAMFAKLISNKKLHFDHCCKEKLFHRAYWQIKFSVYVSAQIFAFEK